MKFVLFDTETTGTEEQDRIIQAAAMIVDEVGNVEVVESLCQTDREIPYEAMEVHNITPEMLTGMPVYAQTDFKRKLDDLNTEGNYLIAHNIKFDHEMLTKEGFECKMQMIDTLRCARHLFPDQRHHRLQYLRYSLGLYKLEQEEAQKHGIEIKAHDAIGDVLVMKLLLRVLMQQIRAQYPEANIMNKLIELTNTPVLMQTINFGKHNGKPFAQIAQEDRQYLQWLRNNTDAGREDLLYTIDYYLNGGGSEA